MVQGVTLVLCMVGVISSTQGFHWPHEYLLNFTSGILCENSHEPKPVLPVAEPKVETFLGTPETLCKNDYQSERHVVRTQDDYIITLDRIPHGKKKFVTPFTKPVILVRSMFSSSNEYIYLGPQDALAYKLADAGYDVWMVNLRGVFQSQGHMSLVATNPPYWDFSWHEMGVYDVTAAIDYVVNHTHHHHVSMVGYDMGATAMLVALSQKPEYNSKVRLAVLMAPLVFTEHMEGPLKYLSTHIVPEMFGAPSSQPVMPQTALQAISDISNKLCTTNVVVERICRKLKPAVHHVLNTHMTLKDVPMAQDLIPDLESLKTVLHFVQGIQSGKFRQYDMGIPEENVLRYGTTTPPEYDLKNVKTPVAIFMSEKDTFASPADVERLKKSLPKVVDTWYSKELTHLDFLCNDRAHHHVYKYLIQLMSKY